MTDWLLLWLGLVAASQSANIIRLGDAHPVAIAAWRLLMAFALLAPVAGGRLVALRQLSRREWLLLVLAGIAMATHFFAWIAAVQRTTVANATIVFSINPVLTGTAGYLFLREEVGARLWGAIAVGLVGVGVLVGSDASFAREHLPGDALALLCSALFTVYFLLGRRLRSRLDNRVYVVAVYAVAAAVAFATLVALRLPLWSYSPRTWLCFGLMALVPTMLGHTFLNYALRYFTAGRISALTLSEPLLAGLVAYVAWDEGIGLSTVAGYALVSLSVLLTVFLQTPTRRSLPRL